MGKSIKSQAISGVKWSAVSKIYTTAVSVLQVAILTRFLDKEDFGLMGVAVLINAFCSIFVDMGMSAAALHEKELNKCQFSSFYWFNLVSGLIITVFVSTISPLIASYYDNSELIGIISITSLSIFISSISSLQRTLQQKKMNFRFMSIVDIVSSTIGFGVNLIMATQGFGVYSLVCSQLITGIFTAIAYLSIAIFKEKNICLYFRFAEIRDALKIGLYQSGSSVLDFLSREMDSLIISSNISMEFFGIYTLCKNLTMRIYMVINPIITNVVTPILAKMQDDKDKLSDVYKRIVELLGFVNFPIYSMIAICSYSIISILYGESYCNYAFVLSCLAIYYAFQSCGNPIGSMLIATGRTDRGFIWTVFRIVFTFVYLNIAAKFDLNIFMIFILFTPILTSYPSWYIILRVISTINYKESLLIIFKAFFVCIPFYPLYFLDRFLDSPILSICVISIIFVTGYYFINRWFRLEMLKYMMSTLKQFIRR